MNPRPPPSLRVSTSSLSRSSAATASRRRTFCSPSPPSSRCITTTARSAAALSLPHSLLLLLLLLLRQLGLATPSPLIVWPSLHFSPHSRPHLILSTNSSSSLALLRPPPPPLHFERSTIIRHRWSLAGSLAHSLARWQPHCSLLLHRLHSLTASLRRLTNRPLLLSSLSPLSPHCVFFMHLINLLPLNG